MQTVFNFVLAVLIVAMGLAGVASTAAAQDAPDYAGLGFYLTLGAAGNIQNFDTAPGVPDFSNAGSGILSWGYRVKPWLAAEFQIEGTGSFKIDDGSSDDSVTITQFVYTGNLKLYPLHGRIQPYAKVGLGGQTAMGNLTQRETGTQTGSTGTETATGFTVRFAAGADFYIDEGFYLFVEGGYVLPVTSAIDGLDYATIGAGIGFAF